MGVAFFIVLDREIENLDTMMDGKSLAQYTDELDAEAKRLGVRSLLEFFSADPTQAAEFIGAQGEQAEASEFPPLQQFRADDGLATVRALLTRSAAWDQGVLHDLRDCERILAVAVQHGAGWHFEADF